MKKLLPLLIALLGLGAGVGAGLALKPAPGQPRGRGRLRRRPRTADGHAEADPRAARPPRPIPSRRRRRGEKKAREPSSPTSRWTSPSSSRSSPARRWWRWWWSRSRSRPTLEAAPSVEAVKPRLRDSFLKVMFRHANSGGFDGSFTAGRKMEDLKSALLAGRARGDAGDARRGSADHRDRPPGFLTGTNRVPWPLPQRPRSRWRHQHSILPDPRYAELGTTGRNTPQTPRSNSSRRFSAHCQAGV